MTRVMLAIVLGIAGPLAVAIGTGALTARTWRRNPERLTSLMIAALGAKLVFFAVYVAVVIGVLSLDPIPFVVSFTTAFIACHLTEALWLRRLFDNGATPGGRG
jgi:hypothetical protein